MSLRVKEILKEKGMMQKDLAAKMGVADISLSRSINGNPSMDTIIKIAEALEVEVGELFYPMHPVMMCPKCGAKLQLKEVE